MDSRLEMERCPAQPTTRPETMAVSGSRGTRPAPTPPLATARTNGIRICGEERISVDPLHATDRYRLVVPYSLRV